MDKKIKPYKRLSSKTPGPKFQCCTKLIKALYSFLCVGVLISLSTGPKRAAQRQDWNLGMRGRQQYSRGLMSSSIYGRTEQWLSNHSGPSATFFRTAFPSRGHLKCHHTAVQKICAGRHIVNTPAVDFDARHLHRSITAAWFQSIPKRWKQWGPHYIHYIRYIH